MYVNLEPKKSVDK